MSGCCARALCVVTVEKFMHHGQTNAPYTAFARPKMAHCYCMLPYFREAREGLAKITESLKR